MFNPLRVFAQEVRRRLVEVAEVFFRLGKAYGGVCCLLFLLAARLRLFGELEGEGYVSRLADCG